MPWKRTLLWMPVLAMALSGCSIKKIAMNKLGDALASGGTAFASDDDPELIKAAAPFSLKLMESVLTENPRHERVLLAAASGFTQYAYAFVQQEADELASIDFAAGTARRHRARDLYLRARDYGLRGLEVRYPGFGHAIRLEPEKATRGKNQTDVPLLYWTAVSWAAAIALSKDDPELVSDLPSVEAMIDAALALEPTYEHGAIHSFLITYEASRQGGEGDPALRSRRHFEEALALSGGQQAGPFVALAEAVAVQKQDRREFESLLQRALAVDPNARSEWRLVNRIMQRRARWLLSRTDELILPPIAEEKLKTSALQPEP